MPNDGRIEKINVILVEAGKRARVIEMDNNLKTMQGIVGGLIQEYMPFEDPIAIVCNDEGKIMGLPYNRGIRDEDGKLMDIIAGNFFICYAPAESEYYLPMPPDLEKKYINKFALPERMSVLEGERVMAPYIPEQRVKEADLSR